MATVRVDTTLIDVSGATRTGNWALFTLPFPPCVPETTYKNPMKLCRRIARGP